MEPRAHYILVGLFTLLAGAGALLFTMWMTGAGSAREVTAYEVLFREPVAGLSVGSPVQYSGIRVGEVEQLTLDPRDPRIVHARIEVLSNVPVKIDTIARQTLLNITGASAIELSEGLPESPRLTAANGIPVIEATPSSLAQLRVTSEELLVSASSLLDRANQMFSDENAQRVSRVIDNVDTVTSVLAEQQFNLRAGIEGLADSSRSLNELLRRADTQLARYEEPVLGGVSTAVDDLQQVSRQLNTLLAESTPAINAGLQGVAELGPAIAELRSILVNIDTVTRQLSEDPASFVLGSGSIQEYRP